MDTQQLKHFIVTAKFGSMHVAAAKSHITQSGLSRSIRMLEKTLGMPLFSRNARGVELTAYGSMLLPWARSIVNQSDRVDSEFRSLREARSGTLHLGLTFNLAESFAPLLITELLKRNAALQVSTIFGSQSELSVMLQAAELDFVFGVVRPVADAADLSYEPLAPSRSGVFCRPAHPLSRATEVTTQQLSRATWALISSPQGRTAFREHFTAKRAKAPVVSLYTNSLPHLLAVVRTLDVVTNVPEHVVRADVADGRLVQLRCSPPVGHATVGFLRRSNDVLTPAMRAVMDLIRGLKDRI